LSSNEAISEMRQRSRLQLGIPETGTVVGFLGRLAPQKAPDLAVRVFGAIRERHPDLVCVLAGDGPERGRTEAVARDIGIQDSIIWVPHATGKELIPAFDVFLMTSRYEGFPYTLVEALNSGCAIVTTDIGGARTCVRDQVNGYIVERQEPEALAAAVMRAVGSRQKCAEMQQASRRMAAGFSRERMAERTLAVYATLLARRDSVPECSIP
jgi:glycosyltransferase involved in cell wall biosynthesis